MNSNYGKSNSFDFDLGLNKSGGNRSLNEQKNKNTAPYSSSSSSYNYSAAQNSRPGTTPYQGSKPAWTHQPAAPIQSGPTSMVGDIFGKTWSSGAPASGIGVVGLGKKDPNLFGDLLSSALGHNKGSNVPLKNAAPAKSSSSKSSFSMGGMSDSLPKTSASTVPTGFGSYKSSPSANLNGNGSAKTAQPMKGMSSNSNKDPFGSLVDFTSKNSTNGGIKSGANGSSNKSSGFGDDSFGDFQNAPKPSGAAFSSKVEDFGFGFSQPQTTQSAPKPSGAAFSSKVGDFGFGFSQPQTTQSAPKPSGAAFSSKIEDFGFGFSQPQTTQSQPSVQSSGVNDFDALFQSNTGGFESQDFSGGDDWDKELGGGYDSGETTTELDGLPPPPVGVSSASAKSKGVDNYKNGQFADAIKWLSWAVILLEKARDDAGVMEVLTCRASSYKEVGEYKKAVADCTKALDLDGKNVAILVQRALLYESMEKYKLGAEDLRTVMNLDPSNRVARSTIHRLTKMAEM